MNPSSPEPKESAIAGSFNDLVALGRVASVPTVISNCIAGWVLSGEGNPGKLILVCLTLSLLHIAISWLVVLVDVRSEAEYQRAYPWLSDRVRIQVLWVIWATLCWVGVFLGIACSRSIGILSCCIVFTGLVIACTHRIFFLSALLPGFLRAFYYIAGGCAAWGGLLGYTLWGAVGILFFLFGTGVVTRQKWSAEVRSLFIPFLAFSVPLVLCLISNDGEYRRMGIGLVLLVLAWLMFIFYQQNIRLEMPRTTAYLTATICLIDFLSAGCESISVAICIGVLFILSIFTCKNVKRLDDVQIIL